MYVFNKELHIHIADRIKLEPVNLIDLLPNLKFGCANLNILFALNFLDHHLSITPAIDYYSTLKVNYVLQQDGAYLDILRDEMLFVFSLRTFFQDKHLTKENHTIYDVAGLIVSRKDCNKQKFIEQISNTLVHPKVDPLLLSTILNKPELVTKYLDDERSNKLQVYKGYLETNPNCCEIIKDKLVLMIFFSKQIFPEDLSCYVFVSGML